MTLSSYRQQRHDQLQGEIMAEIRRKVESAGAKVSMCYPSAVSYLSKIILIFQKCIIGHLKHTTVFD